MASKNQLRDICIEKLKNIYSGENLMESLSPILNLTDDNFALLQSAANAVYDAVMAVGISMIVIYFTMSLIESMQRDNMTLEFVIKKIMELVVAACLIGFGYDIAIGIMQFGDAPLSSVQEILQESIDVDNTFLDAEIAKLYDMDKGELKDYKWELLIPELAQNIGVVVASIAAYSRAIEFYIRLMGFPIAVSNVFNEGVRSPGVRYIKKLFAVAMQSFIIFAILHSGSLLMNAILSGATTGGMGVFAPLVLTYVQITLIFKSQNFANDLMGV